MKKFYKVLVIALCAVMLVAGSTAATVAYLSMKTAPVQNTFTAGNINIELKQDNQLDTSKMVPGIVYEVDPKVIVKANSESCWLFIKIEKPDNFNTFLNYGMVEGWTSLENGVYYRQVGATTTEDVTFGIIKDDQIVADASCTKAQYDTLNYATLDLKITAYAVQQVGFDTAAAAWTEAQKLDS